MKKIIALVFTSFLAVLSLRADVIWIEPFNYSNGPVSITSTNGTGSTTVSNWFTHSGSQDCYVNNKRLEVCSSTTYGNLTITRSGDVNRPFATNSGSIYTNSQQVIYVSFIVNFTNMPTANGAYFAHFKYGSSSFICKLWALAGNPAQTTNNFTALPSTFRMGISATSSGSPSGTFPMDLALNTDYQVVIKWDPIDLVGVSMWINPVSSDDLQAYSSDSLTPSTSNIPNAFAFRQASGFGGFLTVSNLVVATTFDEAVTNTLPTNAVAPVIIYQPTGATNFSGSSFMLSAVANGQGLGELTYQWRKDGSDISNPAGNTNVFAFSSAQASDSGNYTLVATTPYGLSVTSSVATVLVSDAPVPPTFTSQPATNTVVYKGQTVVFSVIVSSPGNVTYQWKSNSVDIAGANTDTLTLANVQTNFSAIYTVAVTNDVVTDGVISSNLVLSVINPTHVSIAYLRSLVDSSTFLPNAPITVPYEITGTVTTYTNITTSDTASYFLQDGTAGINVFATFGSTFRPAQGDVVTFTGVLSSYSTTGLELFADTVNRPYTSYSIVSNNFPLPTPITIPYSLTNTYGYAYVATNIAGSLVTLTNVYFGTNAGIELSPEFMSANYNFYAIVTNASGETFKLQFFTTATNNLTGTLPDFAYTVTGVLYGLHPNYSVGITAFSDIVTTPSTPTTPTSIDITSVSYNGSDVMLTWEPTPSGTYSYTVWYKANLTDTSWTEVGSTSGDTSTTISGQTAGQGFYRVSSP